jgi:hypothetical protein
MNKTQILERRLAAQLALLYSICELPEGDASAQYNELLVALMAEVHGEDVVFGSDLEDEDTDEADEAGDDEDEDLEEMDSDDDGEEYDEDDDDVGSSKRVPTLFDIEEDEEKFGRSVSQFAFGQDC